MKCKAGRLLETVAIIVTGVSIGAAIYNWRSAKDTESFSKHLREENSLLVSQIDCLKSGSVWHRDSTQWNPYEGFCEKKCRYAVADECISVQDVISTGPNVWLDSWTVSDLNKALLSKAPKCWEFCGPEFKV